MTMVIEAEPLLDERLHDLVQLLDKDLRVRPEASELDVRILDHGIYSLYTECIDLGAGLEATLALRNWRLATGSI